MILHNGFAASSAAHPPLEGEGRFAWSNAECEAG